MTNHSQRGHGRAHMTHSCPLISGPQKFSVVNKAVNSGALLTAPITVDAINSLCTFVQTSENLAMAVDVLLSSSANDCCLLITLGIPLCVQHSG